MRDTYGTMYYVDSMKKSIAYYRKLLGIKPAFESPEWTEFKVGAHRLCLHVKRRGEDYTPNGVLIVNARGVKALHQALKRKRLRVGGLHEVHPAAWTFTLEDVSGNELSFYGSP